MDVTGPVLVGIDSSENAKSALRWAAEYASHVGVAVEAVIAWDVPATYGYAMVTTPDPPEYEKFAAAALLGSVSQHCVQQAHCPVVVIPHDVTT